MNNARVAIMMIGMVGLFMVVGYMIGQELGMAIAFGLATVINVVTYWFSDKMVLRMYRARRIQANDHPRLYSAVQRVTTKASMPMPRVYIIPTKAPNAFATGRNVEHSAVAATEGLLEMLNDDELEGVIGHEVAHIRNRDMLIGTIAATLAGAIGIVASIARWGAIFGGYSRENDRGGLIGLLAVAIVAPLAAMLIQMAISRQREYKADEIGARLTGKHKGLASALRKLHNAPVRMNLDQRPATAHLMIANPLSGRGMASMFSTHPPVEKRIARLQELETKAVYQPYAR